MTPAWVQKRDGTRVPFDADKISRALFAAGESLGQPDAFLARELADGVVHFLAAELETATPTTKQIAETVIKIVRELGQPALAQAFADGAWVRTRHGHDITPAAPVPETRELSLPVTAGVSQAELLAGCLRGYALQEVFTRDLVAAHRGGLITLRGLEAPFELAGCVLDPVSPDRLFESMVAARRLAAETVALDGPECVVASEPERWPAFAAELGRALAACRLRAVVNLNCATPPASGLTAAGPLFADPQGSNGGGERHDASDKLLAALASNASRAVRIDWHLGEDDLRPEAELRLRALARRALEGAGLVFVFDRPRNAVALGDGLDRKHPAVLLTVQLNLPALVAQAAHSSDAPARFLHKLGSLVRLALSAGVQKRDFLRRHSARQPELARGFLLDRARLIVAPFGLDAAVEMLMGHGPAESADALDFARRIIERLRDVVGEDGRSRHLDVGLDGANLTDADVEGPILALTEQLRVAAALHAAADLGTVRLRLSAERLPAADELANHLRWLWKRSEITCLELIGVELPRQQLTFSP